MLDQISKSSVVVIASLSSIIIRCVIDETTHKDRMTDDRDDVTVDLLQVRVTVGIYKLG